tara:strand:+ start:495 stop:1085 length:591 start_codon:yes stop_codon:yes gene_type:complete
MGTIKTTNIEPIADNGTVTLGSSGDTFTVPSGVTITNNGTQTGFGGVNTPNFFARLDSNQTGISNEAWTKVSLANEVYDSDNAFDTSTYRFTVPSGKAGKYFFQFSIYGAAGDNDLQRIHIALYKNGSTILTGAINDWTNQAYRNAQMYSSSGVIDLSVGDYIELYGKLYHTGSGQFIGTGADAAATRLVGYKIIE